ncbi:hypothetical protein TRICI_006277 [Trichomonascus ciferrii]|uniref:CWH43-like N-terminal domain-containing protein n=1 Tax=Trichomonascus ciferrii TaxID=44093 RepID=A0A642UN52_9ASCO|nr:hypothetical protein TRICI_006277 [Trichomonascus ciferrii]
MNEESNLPNYLFAIGLIRSSLFGLSAFVPSEDDHDLHDMATITYTLLTVLWMLGITFFAQLSYEKATKYRRRIAQSFVFAFIPLGHYLIQHRLYQVPGAYSKYALFEWLMVVLDIAFDAVSIFEFQGLEIQTFGPKSSSTPSKAHIDV